MVSAVKMVYVSSSHSARPVAQSTRPAVSQPISSRHWLPSTLVAATDVKKAGPRRWPSRSAKNRWGKNSRRARYRHHISAYSAAFSANRPSARAWCPSMCAPMETMPVAMTMPKLAGDMPASAVRQGAGGVAGGKEGTGFPGRADAARAGGDHRTSGNTGKSSLYAHSGIY